MVCWTRAASVPGKSHPPASAPSAKREQHTTAQFRPGCPPGREKPLTCWVWATPALQFLPQAACKQGSALARHEQHTLKSSWARGPSYTAWTWVEDEHLDMGTGGRWQLPPATSTLQCRMEPPRGPRLLGTEQCWLQAGSASLPSLTGGRSIHHQRHNGSPPTATGFESCMCLGNPDIPLIQQKKEEEKKKSPQGLFSVPFVVPTYSSLVCTASQQVKDATRDSSWSPSHNSLMLQKAPRLTWKRAFKENRPTQCLQTRGCSKS